MSKDIRSYFTSLGVKKASQTAAVANRKRVNAIESSDEEDLPKEDEGAKKQQQKLRTPGSKDRKSKSKVKSPSKKSSTPPSLKKSKTVKQTSELTRKRVVIPSSDEDDAVQFKKIGQSSKKRRVLSSESEDVTFEVSLVPSGNNHDTKNSGKKERLVPNIAEDFFCKSKVKQTPVDESMRKANSSKETSSKSSKSDDKFEATLKQIDQAKSKNADDFEKTLLELDDDFDVDIIDETINAAGITAEKKFPSKTKEQNRNGNSSYLNDSISTADPDQEKHERKRQSFQMYQKFLHRPAPPNQGNKEMPEGKPDCLKGICFLKTGVLDSMQHEEFENLIKKHGGRTVKSVSKKVNYLVVGVDAGPAKLSKAEEYGIKSITEDELLDMILTRSGMEAKYVKIANGEFMDENDDKSSIQVKKQDTHEDKNEKDNSKGTKIKKENTAIFDEPQALRIKPDYVPESTKLSPKKQSIKPQSDKSEPGTSKAIVQTKSLPVFKKEPAEVYEANISFVEKYKPTQTCQILGQQKNVDLLRNWLKNWSSCHLGKNKPKLQRPNFYSKCNDDGAFFKCALLSGPPGVGKTTTATLVAEELGYDVVEYNASDTRSKRLLQDEILRQLNSKSLASFAKGGLAPTSRHVLLMDEVDGMSGNEDRGGMQELISLIGKTHIPIICMCNDRNHQKMRSLLNHCFDLQFGKPTDQQLRAKIKSICYRESEMFIPNAAIEHLITASGNDVRQILNHLAMWKAFDNSCERNDAHPSAGYTFNRKDVVFGPWQVVRKQLDWNEYNGMGLMERSRLFYHDYSIGPLFMQENYLNVVPHKYPKSKQVDPKRVNRKCHNNVKRFATAAASISMSDVIEKKLRSTNNWALLEAQGLFSTVVPSFYVHGQIKGGINFPRWLGKNSKATKFKRMLGELRNHTRSSLSCGRDDLNIYYLRCLRTAIVEKLTKENVDGAIEVMHTHNLLRIDFDNIIELTTWHEEYDEYKRLPISVKSAFTKSYNKSHHMLPYAVQAVAKKRKRAVFEGNDYGDEDEESHDDDDDDDGKTDDITKGPMIKQLKPRRPKKSDKEKEASIKPKKEASIEPKKETAKKASIKKEK